MDKFSGEYEDMQILIPVWQRKRQWIYWIGHVLRHNIGLLHEIIEGKMRSKPRQGRRRIHMLQDLANDALKRAAEDRE